MQKYKKSKIFCFICFLQKREATIRYVNNQEFNPCWNTLSITKGDLEMALIKCPECKKEISDKASCCPDCGCPAEEWNMVKTVEKKNDEEKSEIPIFL